MVHEDIRKNVEKYALGLIRERFEDGPVCNRLTYHNREHTGGVIRRATAIAKMMQLSVVENTLVVIAASFHDTTQEWEPFLKGNGIIFRQKESGLNEATSTREAVSWMKEYSGYTFSGEECELVGLAIMATIPSWDSIHSTVIQKNLTQDSHPVIRAVAMADLGSAGMEPKYFENEGFALFLEQEIDIAEKILALENFYDIDFKKQREYLGRYYAWMNIQAKFAEGRVALLEEELGNLTGLKRQCVKSLFFGFAESISLAKLNAKPAEECSFFEMVNRLKGLIK